MRWCRSHSSEVVTSEPGQYSQSRTLCFAVRGRDVCVGSALETKHGFSVLLLSILLLLLLLLLHLSPPRQIVIKNTVFRFPFFLQGMHLASVVAS